MTTRCRLVFLLIPVVALFAACSSGGGGETPTMPRGLSTAQVEFSSFGLVNDARSDNGVDPQLELRQAVSDLARAHSEAMRDDGFFGHDDILGRRVGERLADAGISFRVVAENLAMVTNSATPASWVHDRLMESAEHRPNILSPDFQLIGVGVATDGTTFWVTQVFIGL